MGSPIRTSSRRRWFKRGQVTRVRRRNVARQGRSGSVSVTVVPSWGSPTATKCLSLARIRRRLACRCFSPMGASGVRGSTDQPSPATAEGRAVLLGRASPADRRPTPTAGSRRHQRPTRSPTLRTIRLGTDELHRRRARHRRTRTVLPADVHQIPHRTHQPLDPAHDHCRDLTSTGLRRPCPSPSMKGGEGRTRSTARCGGFQAGRCFRCRCSRTTAAIDPPR
jgi:hypothetical protein